mmetsp:Transcript_24434/g.77434  ORF Transcript_24434/g.77434 Transcript_24434/m.77434 type:complete len:533 (+) Transcript_24434:1169-2767(+)
MKRDGEADAEFNWMLEMWGYSVAAARAPLKHLVVERLQIEPSQQFGVRITPEAAGPRWYEAGGEPTHHVLHYTFSHEFSRDGVPMVDNRDGEWKLDKRAFQRGVPRDLPPPPRCALEAAWVLWRKLHETMEAAAPGPDHWEDAPLPASPTAVMAARTRALSSLGVAARLVGSGPWRWGGDGDLYLLRGGWAMTPWGSARWGAAENWHEGAGDAAPAGAQVILYLCGYQRWTHSARLEEEGGTATLVLEGRPPPPAAGDARGGGGAGEEAGAARSEQSRAVLRGPLLTPTAAEAEDAASAIAAADDTRADADADPAAVRRRLLGTGPWEHGPLAGRQLFFLAGGVAFDGLERRQGNWSVLPPPAGGALAEVRLAIGGAAQLSLEASCWRLRQRETRLAAADFVWKAPARRCFSSCSDRTSPPTEAAVRSSGLGRVAMAAAWSWGFNREGVRFVVEKGEALFRSPWGQGRWGFVPSRDDVIFVDFAQQMHMLRFDRAHARFVSTRCSDGDTVSGNPLGDTADMTRRLEDGWDKW